MTTLTIDGAKARSLYPSASSELKAILDDSFGKDYFSADRWKNITTMQQACDEVGMHKLYFEETGLSPDEVGYRKVKVITEAINGDWKPDWSNQEQPKWFIWWDMSGPVPSLDDVDIFYRGSYCSSRLCFESSEKAKHAANNFAAEYKEFLT
jgi:hypothetical protein